MTSAINRIIEDMNHRFLISVLTEDFTSHDLRLTAANLRKERNPQKRTDVLDTIDTEAVTRRLMELLDIRNREEQSIGITQAHVNEIKEYLAALELIVDCPIETADPDAKPVEHILFTQPGMRYCQAQALVHALMKDETFAAHSELEKAQVTERILEEVRGRMMEDIVLLETLKAADRDHRVFRLQFAAGEFDMVIYNERERLLRSLRSSTWQTGANTGICSMKKSASRRSGGSARFGDGMCYIGVKQRRPKRACSIKM
ncbi:MAG: hypothetical protein ACLUEU_01915 [Oscillospiraceae bacterium]